MMYQKEDGGGGGCRMEEEVYVGWRRRIEEGSEGGG